MAPCRLIVHADDLGQSESINRGVIVAHREGILTSASLMPPGRAFDAAVDACRANPSLDVGVHLCLLEEAPLSPPEEVPTLLGGDGRMYPSHAAFIRRYLRGAIDRQEVRRELDAQIRRVLDAGLPVSHLDSHQHLHMLPGIRGVVSDLGRQHGIPAIRYPRERPRGYMLRHGWSARRFVQLIALNAVCSAGRTPGPVVTDHFVGFFHGGRSHARHLRALLRHLPPSGTCELMCHPGAESSDGLADPDGYLRPEELEALVDPAIAAFLEECGIERISYRDLAGAQGLEEAPFRTR
jgi:hopanoid biosynthesis associated protein HpnK